MINVGAFVDLGGVDGFLPVSEMSWGRVSDPTEVVKEGERINVIVTKIDLERNRISLSYKDAGSDPWKKIDETFVEGDKVRGRVTNLMAFGAFVELAPGVEGLVHISEIC
ncbi:MAG: S1 RNA-binding domain-containing protein, partial [Clostridia bacterium]|nr:S1 RNA-binding domain-containing protein [Clostridia bacterium]